MASQESMQGGEGGLHLLSLPAEMRNFIYAEVLISNERIKVTKDNYQQPSLLRVNHQIRHEARPIYYCQNNFTIACPDFDATALVAFRIQSRDVAPSMLGIDGKKPAISLKSPTHTQPRNWSNLFRWLGALHQDDFLIRFSTKGDPGRRVARAMMLVAVQLHSLSWRRVKHILRDVASAHHVMWT
ncbi:hypothetical protein M409DRAFT_16268 [Zasmidium cellare ATCC 36951]|uniref:F-box domain-containing protein n=1 Tax=Zasmidium cellare ATCC 36951 TaxID=1080233 RepID=A0A6A6D3P0_ZASCE|nr:uncharacterized protein M409DRAFT_16268 [Zasmidium cellare ATCC 36951]KAF2173997.1 hypothetical protein M409DRAFT_16268 [Zasmidium cellare ATCC 36951]